MPSFLTAWAMCAFALIQYSHSSALSFGHLSKKYPCGQRRFLQYWIHHSLLVLKWHRQIGGLELFLKEVQKCVLVTYIWILPVLCTRLIVKDCHICSRLFRIELGTLQIKVPSLWITEPGSQVEVLIDHTFCGSAWKQCETQTDQ